MFYNFNHLEIKEPKRIRKRINLPYLTTEAWTLLAAGILGGVIGGAFFSGVIFPFLR
jgi:hypothetical protein